MDAAPSGAPGTGGTSPSSLLLGAASLDIYLGRGLVLPGGGVLNMAWHLRDEPEAAEALHAADEAATTG